jgi:integrase
VGSRSLDASWRAIAVGFLVEKSQRTGSRHTTQVYGRTVGRFLGGVGDPATATALDVLGFAYGVCPDGSPPSPSTISVRLAAVSGFYDLAQRMGAVAVNPAHQVRRPQARRAPPRGLSLGEVARLLAVIPETPAGLLDRAIVVTALLTGLRRSELVALRLLDAAPDEPTRFEVRTKGGVVRRRELPAPALAAIRAAAEAMGRATFTGDARVFPISDVTFNTHLRGYGAAAGLAHVSTHVLRHTAAKLRRGAGASIEAVSSLLGHRNIATTAIYLRQLEDERDDGWESVALAMGIGAGRAPTPGMPPRRPMAWAPMRARPAIWKRPGGRANAHPVHATGAQRSAPLSATDSSSP